MEKLDNKLLRASGVLLDLFNGFSRTGFTMTIVRTGIMLGYFPNGLSAREVAHYVEMDRRGIRRVLKFFLRYGWVSERMGARGTRVYALTDTGRKRWNHIANEIVKQCPDRLVEGIFLAADMPKYQAHWLEGSMEGVGEIRGD